ncbi:hypothetical protein ABE218_08550 [Bacillus smithii]|uniref:hypothetical protein n=1 Tax=Bacillus smithii TaxID=1479 RepID=UPI003D19C385
MKIIDWIFLLAYLLIILVFIKLLPYLRKVLEFFVRRILKNADIEDSKGHFEFISNNGSNIVTEIETIFSSLDSIGEISKNDINEFLNILKKKDKTEEDWFFITKFKLILESINKYSHVDSSLALYFVGISFALNGLYNVLSKYYDDSSIVGIILIVFWITFSIAVYPIKKGTETKIRKIEYIKNLIDEYLKNEIKSCSTSPLEDTE